MTRGGPRRDAILEAMIHVAGGKGYTATSISDVTGEAGASRATFYKYFDSKLDCFLAAFELAAERILDAAIAACSDSGSWQERTRRCLAAVIELLVADPALAATAIIEVGTVGAEGRRRYWTTIGRLAGLLEEDRPAPYWAELPVNTGSLAVATVAGLIFDELREGHAAGLPGLLPKLEFALLVPYLGPRGAASTRGVSTTSSPSRR